jgi:hypothetical protein
MTGHRRIFCPRTTARLSAILSLFFLTLCCYPQQNISLRIIGKIPPGDDAGLYRLQVGAFKIRQNAEAVYNKLAAANLEPAYEKYNDFTRVIVGGLAAKEIASCLGLIGLLGLNEVIIREDGEEQEPGELPVSRAAIPAETAAEITYQTVKVGETKNIANLVEGRNITRWSSSTPSAVAVNSRGDITGVAIGNAFVDINDKEYVSVAVVPAEDFYVVAGEQVALLPPGSRTGEISTSSLTEYRTEPTFRLAYRFNNKGEHRGASGSNGGIDILGRGENYEWLWTTYYQGGWFYDLNGIKREMVNGYQKDPASGVELTVKPEFVYDHGVPYLQLRHILHNSGDHALSGQKFGASADVMIHKNDYASLGYKPYGAYMADSATDPSLELMLVAESGSGITPVDTLWLGVWGGGTHLEHIYDDRRIDTGGVDSAIGFSYKDISLEAGETKEFIIRFTLARIGV